MQESHFGLNLWRALIRAAHDHGPEPLPFGFGLTPYVNRSARSIGDGVAIDQVVLPVKKSVKRQMMKHAVRDDGQVGALQFGANRSQQLLVELPQMRQRSG